VNIPNELRAKCPRCGRPVRLPFFRVAETVVRRTCKCGSCWAIHVAPKGFSERIQGYVHTATFQAVAR